MLMPQARWVAGSWLAGWALLRHALAMRVSTPALQASGFRALHISPALLAGARCSACCAASPHTGLALNQHPFLKTLSPPTPTPTTAGARCSVYCATSPDLDTPKMQGCYYLDSNCAPIPPSRQAQLQQFHE